MVSKKLDAFPLNIIILPILALFLVLPPTTLYSAIAPEREIVPVDSPEVPTWKRYWDRGRELARLGKYQYAAEYYKELILLKPQIEEAKWEYCKILYHLEEYETASPLLEGLIEANPYQQEYIELAGKLALELGEYYKAEQYLGQAYARTPQGNKGVELLANLIEALEGLGKDEEAFVLLEQLRQRKSADRSLLLRLARKSKQLAKRAKAIDYYSLVVDPQPKNVALLGEAAAVFNGYGESELAFPLWKKIVEIAPRAVSYHQKLADYYLEQGKDKEALPHVLAIIEYDRRFDPELLLIAARIYAKEGERADQSLQYFERYLKIYPQNTEAKEELSQIRAEIAEALLAIVENNGAQLLWNDLGRFTEDRLAIFQIMARNLEVSGKTDELIDVLEIIDENSVDNEVVRFKLSKLYAKKGDIEAAYVYLQKISGQIADSAMFCREKAELEDKLGLDVDALGSYICALDRGDEAGAFRRKAIELAGDLGKFDELLKIGNPLVNATIDTTELDLYLAYVKGLRQNGQYLAAEELYSRMLNTHWPTVDAREQIYLSKAETLRHMGKLFDSQRVLREILAANIRDQQGAIQLIHNVAEDDSLSDGWSLFWYYIKELEGRNWRVPTDSSLTDLFATYIYLLEREGSYHLAINDLKNYLSQYPQTKRIRAEASNFSALELKLCDLYLAVGKPEECRSILRRYPDQMLHNPEVWVTNQYFAGNGSIDVENIFDKNGGLAEPNSGVRGLFVAAEKAAGDGKNLAAMKITEHILQIEPDSKRAEILRAKTLSRVGRLDDAADAYWELHQQEGDAGIFETEYLSLEFKRGRYEFIYQQLSDKEFDSLPVEQKLLLARSLWAMGELKQSLVTYRHLLTPDVRNQFRQRLAEKNLNFDWEEGGEAVFWSLFTYEGPGQLDQLNSLREEGGFLSIAGTPVGEIIAELYDRYRWEKLVKNEYQIREAVEDKNYIIAERQNRARLKEEQSVEGLKDLAKVYERLGNYTKEAEVYDYLQARGESLPELKDLMERNRLARAPTLSGEAIHSERSGRDGAVDIEKNFYGTSFKYLAGLRKEFQLEYGELQYQPESGGSSLDGREFSGKARFELSKQTTLRMEGGLQLLESDADNQGKYAVKFDHEFDPVLSGYLEFREDIVDDTVEALTQGIYSRKLLGGLVIDGASGVSIGGEYQHKWFKGGNNQDGMQFWSSYTFFSDYTSLSLKYSYDMLKSRESNFSTSDADTVDGGTDLDSGATTSADLPYWSPSSYWQHKLSFSFRHLLKDFDAFENTPSYYLVDFAIGYEEDGNVRYTGAFDIFLEMSEHFLLKGDVLYSRSDNYNEQKAAMSLMYRW